MRFKGLDLNLLVVLDALLATRNVSHAGGQLNLSQSATSGALARLREYFGDELLVQQGREMVPTSLGTALQAQVRSALMQIDDTIIARPDFDPAVEQREIRVIASDYVMVTWLAPVVARLSHTAPGLRFDITPPTANPVTLLETGGADLLLMPEKYAAEAHPSTPCFEDDYCVIACSQNTRVGVTLDIDTFYDLPHVDAAFPTVAPNYSDWFIRQSGRERRVVARVGGFVVLPYFVRGTDRIAVVHRRLAERYTPDMGLRILDAPVQIPRIVECLQWHRHADENACLSWVRSEILAGG